jgi:ribonucleoside-diphosphate reductase alpha chain
MKRDSFGRPQDATATQPISHDVLKEKYLKAGETSAEDVYRRVARALASVEAEADRAKYEACSWTTCTPAPSARAAS